MASFSNMRCDGSLIILLQMLAVICMISSMLLLVEVDGVTIVRHANTPNCHDPRQFCLNLAPYQCCAFPDIGARSLEFAQVLLGNVMMGFAPDISGRDMCKYLVKHAVSDGLGQRFCMPDGDFTGGMWRPQLPAPPAPPGPSDFGTTHTEDENEDEAPAAPSPYPWSKCTSYVNATDIDPQTYAEILATLSH